MVANGYHIGQYKRRTFPASQSVPSDSAVLGLFSEDNFYPVLILDYFIGWKQLNILSPIFDFIGKETEVSPEF